MVYSPAVPFTYRASPVELAHCQCAQRGQAGTCRPTSPAWRPSHEGPSPTCAFHLYQGPRTVASQNVLSQCPDLITECVYLPAEKSALALEFRAHVTISAVPPSVGMLSAGHRPHRPSHWVTECRFGWGWATDAAPPSMAGRFVAMTGQAAAGGGCCASHSSTTASARLHPPKRPSEFSRAGHNRRRQPRHTPAPPRAELSRRPGGDPHDEIPGGGCVRQPAALAQRLLA